VRGNAYVCAFGAMVAVSDPLSAACCWKCTAICTAPHPNWDVAKRSADVVISHHVHDHGATASSIAVQPASYCPLIFLIKLLLSHDVLYWVPGAVLQRNSGSHYFLMAFAHIYSMGSQCQQISHVAHQIPHSYPNILYSLRVLVGDSAD